MKNRRIASIIFFISGLTFSGMVLFADALGLDDHSGWGRTRILALVLGIFLTAFAALYLLHQARAESWIAALNLKLEQIPWAAVSLKIWRSYSFLLPIVMFVILIYIWLISSGTWTEWVSPTRYYADLARGFEKGNLFIPGTPDPKLN